LPHLFRELRSSTGSSFTAIFTILKLLWPRVSVERAAYRKKTWTTWRSTIPDLWFLAPRFHGCLMPFSRNLYCSFTSKSTDISVIHGDGNDDAAKKGHALWLLHRTTWLRSYPWAWWKDYWQIFISLPIWLDAGYALIGRQQPAGAGIVEATFDYRFYSSAMRFCQKPEKN